jgi:hypothetical protein
MTGRVRFALLAAAALQTLSTSVPAADQRALQALLAAYPDFLERVDGDELVWRDGTRMPIEDGVSGKTFEQLLNSPDIGDQFAFPYPLGMPKGTIPVNADPGRVRYEPVFVKMYGDCRKGAVSGRLKSVTWLPGKYGKSIRVTTINGVADKIAAVSRELDALPARFDKFLYPPAGIYSCRVIAGTGRKSVHSFAAAIDLNVKQAHYWRWTKPDASGRYPYRNRMPREIVEIFERHGFIWGGKWYHYDTMHFEYRPELIALAKSK